METERNMIRHIGELDMAAVREDLREFEAYLKKQVYHYGDIREAMLCMTVAILEWAKQEFPQMPMQP